MQGNWNEKYFTQVRRLISYKQHLSRVQYIFAGIFPDNIIKKVINT